MSTRRATLTTVGGLTATAISGCLNGNGGGSSGGADGTAEQRAVITTYDDAVVDRNDATERRNIGVNRFNERNYGEAIEPLETALSDYETAETGFAEAASLATETGEESAVAICETAVDEVALQIDATDAALSAARAANGGADAETINGHIETFRTHRDEAAALTVEDTDAVASALGLEP